MSVNYIQRYAGGKVSIEVSDPDDISSLSTLYANYSEARVVNHNAGLYRLIDGAWTYVPGSGGIEDKLPLIIVFSSELEFEEQIPGTVDQSPGVIKNAIQAGKPIFCFYKSPRGVIKSLPTVSTNFSDALGGIFFVEASNYMVADPSIPSEAYEQRKCTWRLQNGSEPTIQVEFVGT